MSDTAAEPRSELEQRKFDVALIVNTRQAIDLIVAENELLQPIWALSWSSGSWPINNGVTYAEAVFAQRTAERACPDHGEHTITTFAATSRQQQSL